MERQDSTRFTSGDTLDMQKSQLGTVEEGLAQAEAVRAANPEVIDPTYEKIARVSLNGGNTMAFRQDKLAEQSNVGLKGDYELVG